LYDASSRQFAFSASTLLVGTQVGCLGQGADLHMAQLMPLPLIISCCSKSRLVLPFWCQLTWVVPDNIQEGRKTVLCVCVCVHLATKFHHPMFNCLEVIMLTNKPTNKQLDATENIHLALLCYASG